MTTLMKTTITLAVVWIVLFCWSQDERLRKYPLWGKLLNTLLDLVMVLLAVNFLVTIWT